LIKASAEPQIFNVHAAAIQRAAYELHLLPCRRPRSC